MTKETSYAYAVGRIRANENSLLGQADIEQLISAPDYKSAENLLADKGYGNIAEIGIDTALSEKMLDVWRLISEILPQPIELEFLIIKNDFHNLKAQVKSIFTGNNPASYYLSPTVFCTDELEEFIKAKKFEKLPDCMAGCAEEAYRLLAKTMDGQLADVVIDRQLLETIMTMAKETGNDFVTALAGKICAFANIKTALRSLRTGKEQEFLQKALCECATLSKQELINACLKGMDGLAEYIRTTQFNDILEKIKTPAAAFEKYCDDKLLEHVSSAKFKGLGIEPVIAYFIAKEAEIKTLRIVMSCKHNEIPADEIRKRVRQLYV